jgi:amino acid adenylation domain-containing protein
MAAGTSDANAISKLANESMPGDEASTVVSEVERRKVLVEWNQTTTLYPRDATIHELFEQQAERTPDAIAVEDAEASLSYRELDRRANRLAREIRASGGTRGSLVAICLDRSVDLLVALVAILKAGAAYVPLDVTYPTERIRLMMDDIEASVVITCASFRERLPASAASVIYIDGVAARIAAREEASLLTEVSAGDLAYVLFTSGSTGRPKGVCVEHRAVVRLVRGQNYATFDRCDVFLQLAPLAFDASTLELWAPLLNGARVIMFPSQFASVAQLGDVIARHGVSVLWLTAGLFQQVVEQEISVLRPVRQLLAGGDVLSVEHVRQVLDRLPCKLVNGYGPTENTTFTCCHPIEREAWQGSVPIGRPISNTRVYVLGETMQPTPVGVTGELYCGGDGVARAYLNRPSSTAGRFVPDPFSDEPGRRLYRTGDIVRYLANGTIEFVGRVDAQFKLRGFRIEPAEIEKALEQHAGVEQAVVLLREVPSGDKRLVSYVKLREPKQASSSELRRWLKAKLPEYMVPSAYVIIGKWPLTPNGKVDRRSLPEPPPAVSEGAFVPAQGATQERLARVFKEVLGADRIGIHDDFFELGGHSLLAAQVVARLRNELGAELSLRALFDAPTVAELEAAIESAPPGAGDTSGRLQRRAHDARQPLSYAQQRLWFLEQSRPPDPTYNVAMVLRLERPLRVHLLRQALQEVVRRHAILRTVYVSNEGIPLQVVDDSAEVKAPHVDLRALAARDREEEFERLVSHEARATFDLATGPVLRAHIVTLSETDHALLVTIHHIAFDGWSAPLLAHELSVLYEAFEQVRPSPLAELELQYADYALYERQRCLGEALEGPLEYWRKQLAEASPLGLCLDRPRPQNPSSRGARVAFAVPRPISQRLSELARRERATMFMALLAAWGALLGRYAGQNDLVIGTVTANRSRADLEPLLGFFVNTIPLRLDLTGDPTMSELVKRVRTLTLDAYEHEVPFDRIVERGGGRREAGRNPLFDVMLVLQNTPPQRASDAFKIVSVDADRGTAMFDMTLSVEEVEPGLLGWFEYRSELFDAATVEQMARRLELLVAAIVARPDAPLAELLLPSEEELQRLLVQWNGRPAERPLAAAQDVFERRARETPHGVALVEGERCMTYGEANARANRLARRLIALGVGRESLVALLAARSIEAVIGILGILKSGAAYVPSDPELPMARRGRMLQRCGVRVGVGVGEPTGLVPTEVQLDAEKATDENDLNRGVVAGLGGLDLAMVVLHTSGTTGEPKAVLLPQRGLMSYALAVADDWGASSSDRVLQFASLSFDTSLEEMLLAWTAGASLVLRGERMLEPALMLEALGRHGVTILQLPTAYFAMVLEAVESAGGWPPSIRLVVIGGERALPSWIERFHRSKRPPRLVNMYGPTEASISVTCCDTAESLEGGRLQFESPLGRVVDNCRVYVLDDRLSPLPPGAVGEICLGGVAVSRGYVREPVLTAQAFAPDPFEPGRRLYRTGDRGRWRREGALEFVGRFDDQVKIRGFRIEPAEIETTLARHPNVAEAVVIVLEPEPGRRQLVGYVRLYGRTVDLDDVRAFAAKHLPQYMVPSALIAMSEWPLTANGKVDRRALPLPDPTQMRKAYEAPRTEAEQGLAAIWVDVLGVPRVGIHDNFFELGGHSLLATQIVARIRKYLGVELPVRSVFEGPTVAQLTEQVRRRTSSPRTTDEPAPKQIARDGPLPLSFAERRLWFLDQYEPATATYNIPHALRLRGRLDERALEVALGQLVARHESLRTRFVSREGDPHRVIDPAEPLMLGRVSLEGLPEPEREVQANVLLLQEARRPFDLAAGPLFRPVLLRLCDEEHVLSLTVHHIVSDAWSRAVMQRELVALYGALLRSEGPSLPPPYLHYADYAAWQQEWLQGSRLTDQMQFWKERLSDVPAMALPTDHSRPPVQTTRGALLPFEVPRDITRGLEELARREAATPFMVLLTGFGVLLQRYSDQCDIVVGTPIANRQFEEFEPLIGFFINTLVLRANFSGDPTIREVLSRVREVCLAAYAHQDAPFEKVVELLQPTRDLSRSPLFQVMFSLDDGEIGSRLLGQCTMEELTVDPGIAHFDLGLYLERADGKIAGNFEFNSDLFDRSSIERLRQHLRTMLAAVASSPDQRISAMPFLSEAERHGILFEWNATDSSSDRAGDIQDMLERQVRRTPDGTAIVFHDRHVTYRELNRQANQLAHALLRRGILRETPVGVLLHRSPKMLVAVLGIIKAGGVVVPLDPSYPINRRTYMLTESGAPLVLTQSELRAQLPAGVELWSVDEPLGTEPGNAPDIASHPEQLCYVIFTSGSTGHPKGVGITHRALSNLLRWQNATSLSREGIRTLQFASLSFDVSFQEILLTLCFGGQLHLISEEEQRDAEHLLRVLNEQRIERTFLPFVAVQSLSEAALGGRTLPALREVITAGEQLQVTASLSSLFASTGARLENQYGPSETHVATAHPLPDDVHCWPLLPAIGRPVSNTRIYLLDQRLRPVPINVAGELYIGGYGVARGYLGRPEITAERFVADPCGSPGSRLYRTGDVARYRREGDIEFLGRIDLQVKVRGFRVELGEIESVLLREPGVRECAVVVRDVDFKKRLLAYLVSSDVDTQRLRGALRAALPEYMVPSEFVMLDEFPLTPSGKVDRRALPTPDVLGAAASEYVAPRSSLEDRLCQQWHDILGTKRVGIHDNFFELGGHSLLATRVLARIRNDLGVNLPVRALFDSPTVAGLAERILAAQLGDLPLDQREEFLNAVEQLSENEADLQVFDLAKDSG